MPRWLSVAAMVAASAFVAPVSTHYISAKNAATSDNAVAGNQAQVVRQVAESVSTMPRAQAATAAKSPTLSQKLQDGKTSAKAQGRADIASLICGFTHQPAESFAQPCSSEPIRNAEVMIAIVPDPVHTRLALRFDREIDVLEEELTEFQWNYDRSWLPWDSKIHKVPDRWEDRSFDSHVQGALETLPGLLLFRKKGANDSPETGGQNSPGDLLIVLLVGENPTGGINSEQFYQALSYWERPATLLSQPPCTWKGDAVCPVPTDLTILGPSFSGSLQSLDTLLRKHFAHWPSSPLSIHIASGTVSDGEALQSLTLPYTQPNVSAKAQSFFPAALELSRDLTRFLLQRNSSLKIAQVREKESSFGSIRLRCADKRGNCSDSDLGSYHYPREISQLRRAYEQNGIIGFSETAGGTHSQLQLSAAQDDRDSDSVGMFAGPVDAVALEAELASLAHELAAEEYSVVLLNGTDVMDEMFVARYLSQHAPNLTIIIEDTDQLFLHEGEDASLNNVYAASPWPLIWQNQRWSAASGVSENTSVRFASAGNQGIANALHHLLCNVKDVAGADCRAESFRGSRSPFAGLDTAGNTSAPPPVWLTLIEHGSFLPVALIPTGSSETAANNLPATPAAEPASGIHEKTGLAAKLLATAIVWLLLWHGWACSRCRLDRSAAWTYALAERAHHRIRLLIKSSLSLVGAFALALLFVPGSSGLHVQSGAFQSFLIAGQLLGVIVSAISIRKLVVFERLGHPRGVAILFGGACFGLLVAMDYHLWPLLAPGWNSGEYRFFLYRVASPFSGGSPALPLLLMTAAAALFLHGMFSRLAFFGHRIPKLPYGSDHVRIPSGRSLQPLTSLLANVCDKRRWLTAAACLLGVVSILALSERRRVLSVGSGPFDYVVTGLLVLAGTVLLQNLCIAWVAWRTLRQKLLIPLRQSPLRWGFTWIKDFSWRRIWRSSKTLSSTQVFEYLFRLLQASSRNPGSGTGPMYYAEVCALYDAADRGKPSHEFTRGVERLQRAMKAEAEVRLQRLHLQWQADRGPLTGSKEMDRGVHLLQSLEAAKGDERASILRRMGDEEFAALIYVGYISMVLIQIRQRILTAAVFYILLLWSLTNYPWMYRHTILLLLVALFAVLSTVTLSIYGGMHRDEILSRTTETETGKLDGGFLPRVLAVLGVPLLSLVASQFPEVSNFVFSWLEPSLSKLH